MLDDATIASFVTPAIADLQHEVMAAGNNRLQRRIAHARGVWAFWSVLCLLPFAPRPVSAVQASTADPTLRDGRLLLPLLAILLGSTWPFLGWMAVVLPVGGVGLAVILHWWHARHPSDPAEAGIHQRARAVEINFSSIPVGPNVGGVIVVVGSLLILLTGVPQIWFFLAGSVAAGAVTAWAMRAWRSARTGPTRSFIAR